MFWVAVLLGGGLLWNAVDTLGGIFLGELTIEVFSLVCGFVLAEVIAASWVVAPNALVGYSHALIQAELPVIVLIAVCTATALFMQGLPKFAFGVLVVGAVYSFIHFKIWQWYIPSVIQGEAINGRINTVYLQQMGLTSNAVNSTSTLRNNFNEVALQGTALTMALLAAVVGVVLTVFCQVAFKSRKKA